jgi:phosphoglycerate dehydrogenase-like enzyme
MKIFMLGEAARHRNTLEANLPQGLKVVELPREAATSAEFDHLIEPDDVLVSLRFTRKNSTAPKFKLLHVPGAGLDGIDFNSLPNSAFVCNVFEHEIPIAEYVLCAMLESEIQFSTMRATFNNVAWPDLYRSRVMHGELFGKSLGIIGFGRIGQEVAKRASAFGMHVIAVNRSPISTLENVDQTLLMSQLDTLLCIADYVVIACPLTQETRGLIHASSFDKMKRESVLINISRAEIVNQQDLYDALSTKKIRSAVLDVWYNYPSSNEDHPPPSDLPFDSLPNVFCTAHSSAWTTRLPQRRYGFIGQNIQRLIKNETLLNIVTRPQM